jgi:Flp pilus assembly pilin Flp
MLQRVKLFLKDKDGAVTVDWVVLCAGIVAIAVAIFTSMQTGALELTGSVQLYMASFFG